MSLSEFRLKEKLRVYLESTYSSRKNIHISELSSIAKGWQTELYVFNLGYIENGIEKKENLVLRMYPGEDASVIIEKEFDVLKALYEVGYSVPKTHFLELDTKVLGKPFLIMDRIIGEDLGTVFVKALEENNLEKIKGEIIPLSIEFITELHDLDWKVFPSKYLNSEKNNRYFFVDNKLRYIEDRIEKHQMNYLLPVLDWLKNNRKRAALEKISIIHGDFHPHNIIIDEKGKGYVIDWPAARVGDFREDLGWTLMLTQAYTNNTIRDAFLHSYEETIGKPIKDIDYFEVLAIIQRVYEVILTLKHGSSYFGLREEALQQIKETIFHIQNLLTHLKEKTDLSILEIERVIEEHR